MYTIGELAKLTGLTGRTLKRYETGGLLVPEKRQDNKDPFYSEKNLDRISRIQFFKKQGFSLDKIKKILYVLEIEEMLALEMTLKFDREIYLKEIKKLKNQDRTTGQLLEIIKHYRTFSPGKVKKSRLLSKKERDNILNSLSESITDNLTGLFNHRYFQATLEVELRKARENSLPLSVVLMGLDDFHRTNFDFGTYMGDRMLKQTGEIIRKVTGDKDILCRYGGDEFTVTCINTEKREAINLAEKIRKAVEEYDFVREINPVKTTISIGVAGFPDDCDTKKDMICIADESLYRAKKGSRNRVCYKEQK